MNKELQIKNGFIYALTSVVGNFIPIVTFPIFTRILSKEDYGILALAQIYAVFMSSLANFGLILGYERNFFQYKNDKQSAQLLYSTLCMVTANFLFFLILTLIFKEKLAQWIIGSAEHAHLLFWVFCSTIVISFKQYYLMYFKNTENAKAVAKYTIDESLLGMAFSIFFVAYLKTGVVGLAYGQLLASLIVLTVLMVRFLGKLPFDFSWLILQESLKISYPLTPRIFLGIVSNQFDKYVLGLLTSIGGVGVYSIGQKFANIVFTFMTAIQNVFSPQVYKKMFELGDEGGKAVGTYLTPFFYISIAVGLFISLFSEEIFFVLTPPSYHGAVPIVMVLAMLYGSYFFGKQPQLIFAKKTYITSLLTMFSITLNILLNIPFVMKWGAIGAAWGTFLAGLISGTISFFIAQHYYNIKWEYRKIIAIIGTFFFSSIFTLILLEMQLSYYLRLSFKLSSLFFYIFIGIRIHVLTWQNVLAVKKTFLRREIDLASETRASDENENKKIGFVNF